MIKEAPPRRGEPDPSPISREEVRLEFDLQGPNLPTECWLGNIQKIGSLANTAKFRDLHEIAELFYFHRKIQRNIADMRSEKSKCADRKLPRAGRRRPADLRNGHRRAQSDAELDAGAVRLQPQDAPRRQGL